jgi:hypothetical protein
VYIIAAFNIVVNQVWINIQMKFILFREDLHTPLGIKNNTTQLGIRKDGDLDTFEDIAEYYQCTVEYTTDISQANLVVFNLNRFQYYSNLNPLLLLDPANLNAIAKCQLPVIFWHSGECHANTVEPWFMFSKSLINRPIVYVDSNYAKSQPNDYFFDSSEYLLNRDNAWRTFSTDPGPYAYKFMSCTNRSNTHKHIITNHLRKYHNDHSYSHYLMPDILHTKFAEQLDDHDVSVPTADAWISEREIENITNQSMIILSINTYFSKFLNNDEPVCYITEKFLLDLSSGKPVIPVGHSGSVEYCRQLGFEFPSWIDYSYDVIKDDGHRMSAILKEIDRLDKLDNLSDLTTQFLYSNCNREKAKQLSFRQEFFALIKQIQALPCV